MQNEFTFHMQMNEHNVFTITYWYNYIITFTTKSDVALKFNLWLPKMFGYVNNFDHY
jgi:hypothetical protein